MPMTSFFTETPTQLYWETTATRSNTKSSHATTENNNYSSCKTDEYNQYGKDMTLVDLLVDGMFSSE